VDFQIRITEQALADFEAIVEYSWTQFPSTSERFAQEILDHVELLRQFPRMGVPLVRASGIRKLSHSPIRIYYRVDERIRLIEILHFWHGSRREPLV
jgi:plasmid stabilization system protein ParE